VVDFLYSSSLRQVAGDVDLILGCGDLPYYYLEYIVSMLDKPMYYVHGNHDPLEEHTPSGERITGPSGGIDLDGRIINCNGYLIGGLQGCIRYKPHAPFQYTNWEMWLKVLALVPRMVFNQVVKGRAMDIFIAHSPPMHIHNGSDHVHRGFTSFLWLLQHFKPRYMFHGHQHVYNQDEITVTTYYETVIHNIYPYKIIELEPYSSD
jgi:Icc-related predicted phosphoesterase